jgi:hypothetical protein
LSSSQSNKTSALYFSISTSKIHLAEVPSLNTDPPDGTTLNYLRGAAGNGRALRSSTFDAKRVPPRASAKHRDK